MLSKQPIIPHRIRQVPKQFSWVDGRLVRDHHIDQCSHPAAALYLFLVTVADARGLSYYADSTICKRLAMDNSALSSSRLELIQHGLIAYHKPIYQILDLAPPELTLPGQRNQPGDDPHTMGQIFKMIMEADS